MPGNHPGVTEVFHRSHRHGVYFALAGVFFSAFVALCFFFYIKNVEKEHVYFHLGREAQILSSHFNNLVSLAIDDLQDLRSSQPQTGRFDRKNFADSCRRMIQERKIFQKILWAPRIIHENRAVFEQTCRNQGLPDFSIYEIRPGGDKPTTAAVRKEYFPVAGVEPLNGNESLLGYDLAAEIGDLRAPDQVRDSAHSAVFLSIRPGTAKNALPDFALFLPAYENFFSFSVPGQVGIPAGYYAAVFNGEDILRKIFPSDLSHDYHVYVFDVAEPGAPIFLGCNRCIQGDEEPLLVPEIERLQAFPNYISRLAFAGRKWEMYFVPASSFHAATIEKAGRLIPFVFFLFSSLLVGLSYLLNKKALDNRLQAERLSLANKHLAAEIEERKQMEDELHHAKNVLEAGEKKYRDLYNSASDAIFIVGRDGRFLDVNDVAVSRLGYSRAELLRMTPHDINPASQSRIIEGNIKALPGLKSRYFETVHLTGDGRAIPTEISARVIEYEGQPAILSFARDITERKKTEHALLERENHYRTLFEYTPTANCVADFSGIRKFLRDLVERGVTDLKDYFQKNPDAVITCLLQMEIHELNNVALELTGAANEADFRENLDQILGMESISFSIPGLAAIARGSSSLEHDFVVYSLSGEKLYGVLRWVVVPGFEENYGRVIITFNDITERKEAEERLAGSILRMQQLACRLTETEEAERRRISRELHDTIGQSLTALGINLNIIRNGIIEDVRRDSEGKIADSLTLVEEMTDRMRDVMADLRPPVLDDYGLAAALRWYAEIFTRRTGIAVELALQENIRLSDTWEMSLFRVAQEALTNIAKHADATETHIFFERKNSGVELLVRDDGRGFEGNSLPTEENRSGWGIVSMRERVEALGGNFSVQSVPGQGTTVTVRVKI
ncbi:MAG: PAS domain S-box protein [Pseudomonadota bacterium]